MNILIVNGNPDAGTAHFSLERNILAFCGIKPVRRTLVGNVEDSNPRGRERALQLLARLGREAR